MPSEFRIDAFDELVFPDSQTAAVGLNTFQPVMDRFVRRAMDGARAAHESSLAFHCTQPKSGSVFHSSSLRIRSASFPQVPDSCVGWRTDRNGYRVQWTHVSHLGIGM